MWVMKNLALGSFILFYASFALLCFASGLVLDHDLHTENTKVVSGHNQHNSVYTSVSCDAVEDNCIVNSINTVLGHAAMYDSVTSVELASLGLVLLLVVSIFFYCRRLFFDFIRYRFITWFRHKVNDSGVFSKLVFLAWTAFHTRSPNLLFTLK